MTGRRENNMNKAILVGRLARDVELRTTQGGTSVASFTLAVNRRFKNADGGYDADFINCVAWRQSAEYLCKNYSKGDMVGISGSIQTRSYDKDGSKVYITEVIADEIHYVGGKRSEAPAIPTNEQDIFMPMPPDDDLPF